MIKCNLFKSAAIRNFKIPHKRAKLLSFTKSDPGSFEDFKTKQLANYSHLYKANQDEKIKAEYLSWVNFKQKFLNLCKTQEIVSIINNHYSDCIILSKYWQGNVTDHEDLILRPFKKRTSLFDIKGERFVEISSAAKILTSTGNYPVLNSKGNFKISFKKDGDALKMYLNGGQWKTNIEAIFELLD